MNWLRVVLSGIVGGIVLTLADFVLHGMIMAGVYTRHNEVFAQEQANPAWFVLVAIWLGLMAAILFAKTRSVWAEGIVGGATYGFFLGLVWFFQNFYHPLVIEGFPYHLAWCWGGINVIDGVILGCVLGLIYKK